MGNIIYKNLNDLTSIQNTSYLLAILVVALALLIAIIIANMIAFEGGLEPRDRKKRTWGYWLVGILATLGFFSYNHFIVTQEVAMGFRPDFQKTNLIATGSVLGAYILLGYILKLVFQKKKFGTIRFWFK